MMHTSSSRFIVPFVAAALVIIQPGIAPRSERVAAQPASNEPVARATHVLNRLTFGPRPGEAEHVVATGIDRWIERQLRPESIADSAGRAALDGCPLWTDPIETAVANAPNSVTLRTDMGATGVMRMSAVSRIGLFLVTRDSALRSGASGRLSLDDGQLIACRLARVERSDQQLLEVMTDFWLNHFSIFGGRIPSRGSIIEWDRAIIRPNALGRFRDLLGAVAHSPTMLTYLDNAVSAADSAHRTLAEYVRGLHAGAADGTGTVVRHAGGLNENYARELLELHTLGVDGGYTQQDVIDVARALTGWTHSARAPGGTRPVLVRSGARLGFVFDSTAHDADAKLVLGHRLPAGRGIDDGEEVLDLLASHPSTARFIARKLAVRFVSDAPPPALIERAAATFLRTNGDIREVVRTIETSPEFNAPEVHGAKVKSPLELALSMRRALSAPIDTAAETIDLLIALDQPPFGKLTPEGWPETGAAWATAGAMRSRVDIAVRVAEGELPSIPVEAWPEWTALVDAPFDRQVDGVIRTLLGGRASTGTRSALAGARPAPAVPDSPATRQRALRELIALALSSPEFQSR